MKITTLDKIGLKDAPKDFVYVSMDTDYSDCGVRLGNLGIDGCIVDCEAVSIDGEDIDFMRYSRASLPDSGGEGIEILSKDELRQLIESLEHVYNSMSN